MSYTRWPDTFKKVNYSSSFLLTNQIQELNELLNHIQNESASSVRRFKSSEADLEGLKQSMYRLAIDTELLYEETWNGIIIAAKSSLLRLILLIVAGLMEKEMQLIESQRSYEQLAQAKAEVEGKLEEAFAKLIALAKAYKAKEEIGRRTERRLEELEEEVRRP